MRVHHPNRALLLVGFTMMALGPLLSRQQEIHGFKTTLDLEYKLLGEGMISLYVLGALIVLAGCVMTCIESNPRQLMFVGTATSAGAAAMFFLSFGVINIHTWTAGVLFLWELSFIVGIIFLFVGLTRYFLSSRSRNRGRVAHS